MKKFTIPLLGIIFITLIANTVPSIADDESDNNIIVTEEGIAKVQSQLGDPKYDVYLHVVVRNAQGELITVTDLLPCRDTAEILASGWGCTAVYLDHAITHHIFNTALGKKEIITINDVKYEKVQFSTSSEQFHMFDHSDRIYAGLWEVQVCGEVIEKYGYECANIFYSNTHVVSLEMGDVTISNWTILREMD